MVARSVYSSADLSPDGVYRYALYRTLTEEAPRFHRALGVIMVNPSTADASEDDPTIRRVLGFAELWGFGRVMVGNKFAFRATDIDKLASLSVMQAIGEHNDFALANIIANVETVVVAWGPLAKLPPRMRERWKEIVRLCDDNGKVPHCIGPTARDGHPRHPLMLPYSAALVPWPVPWFANRTRPTT